MDARDTGRMTDGNPVASVRPWIEGVAVVADVVQGAVFGVDDVDESEIRAAIDVIRVHDVLAAADLESRLVVEKGGLSPVRRHPDDGGPADWVDGISDALEHLARTVLSPSVLSSVVTSPYSVSVIGLPVTRNEWDARADVEAVSRLLADGLGLTVASCWPSCGGLAELAAAARSGIIVALPWGRAAANEIASKTGARVVEAPLPLGFAGTCRFVETVGAAVGRAPRAAEFTGREVARIVPRFEWVVPHALLNRRIGLVGDAAWVAAMNEFLEEVGCCVCRCFVTGGAGVSGDPAIRPDQDPDEPLALTTGNAEAVAWCVGHDSFFLESTYPCSRHHVYYPRPSLGMDGAAAILQDMVNRMNVFEILVSWKNSMVNEEDRERHRARVSV